MAAASPPKPLPTTNTRVACGSAIALLQAPQLKAQCLQRWLAPARALQASERLLHMASDAQAPGAVQLFAHAAREQLRVAIALLDFSTELTQLIEGGRGQLGAQPRPGPGGSREHEIFMALVAAPLAHDA